MQRSGEREDKKSAATGKAKKKEGRHELQTARKQCCQIWRKFANLAHFDAYLVYEFIDGAMRQMSKVWCIFQNLVQNS